MEQAVGHNRRPQGVCREKGKGSPARNPFPERVSRREPLRREGILFLPVFFLPLFLIGAIAKAESVPQQTLQEFKACCQQFQLQSNWQDWEQQLARLQAFLDSRRPSALSRRTRMQDAQARAVRSWLRKLLCNPFPAGTLAEEIETSASPAAEPFSCGPANEGLPANLAAIPPQKEIRINPREKNENSLQNGPRAMTLPAYPF